MKLHNADRPTNVTVNVQYSTRLNCVKCGETPSKLVRDDDGRPYRECACTRLLKANQYRCTKVQANG